MYMHMEKKTVNVWPKNLVLFLQSKKRNCQKSNLIGRKIIELLNVGIAQSK